MYEELSEEQKDKIIQMVTTEHFTLQTARAGTTQDTNGRSTLFLSTVSSAVVALAFIGQVSELGEAFYIFGLVLFPTLFFLGLVTFTRVLQSAIEDSLYGRGINRIRHLYGELAPTLKPYLILSSHDDMEGASRSIGIRLSRWQVFLTTASMVAMINSVLMAVFVGFLVNLVFGLTLAWCLAAGIVALLGSALGHYFYQTHAWDQAEEDHRVMFPSNGRDEQEEASDREKGSKA